MDQYGIAYVEFQSGTSDPTRVTITPTHQYCYLYAHDTGKYRDLFGDHSQWMCRGKYCR